jgi:glyoxylase I family protein
MMARTKSQEEDGMSFQRRKLLQVLSYTFGACVILPRNGLAQNPAQPAKEAAKHQSGGTEMEKIAGIGGFFFRAHDPKALGQWYQQHLGISLTPTSEGATVWQQEAGPTSFTPFPETTKYFGDPSKTWMINFRVHDMDKMVAQLRAAGIEVKDPETYGKIGRFTRLHDPEGNPIELWQPA